MANRPYRHALPQHLHILPKGHRTRLACGATTGGFVRARDVAWLRRFLRDGGGLCTECRKAATEVVAAAEPSAKRRSA